MIEHDIQNLIRVWCGENGYMCFRCNVGKVQYIDGYGRNKVFDTGLPTGFSDLLCLAPGGKTYFIECKQPGKYQRPDQKKFQKAVESYGFTYILARSVEDVRKVIAPSKPEGL